jgi:hypothetical protein
MLTLEDIVSNMCEGQYADDRRNAASKTKIPWNLLFIDMVLYRNVCPLGHKTQRRDLFLSALYSFHREFWCSIPEIIWRQIQKFCEGVHHRGAEHTKTWGLPFPFLITHILRKMRIRGTPADESITESPYFGPIQWCQSLSHMPRAAPEPAPQLQLEPESHWSPCPWTFQRWQLSMRWHMSHTERQSMRSSQRRMRSVSRSNAEIYYTSKTPSWTYDTRSGMYDFSLQICRGMLVRTDLRSRRCSEPSWTDYLQHQDLLHHHQPRDIFMMSWFIFTPLALHFLYQHTVDSAYFEFGGYFYHVCTFYFLLCIIFQLWFIFIGVFNSMNI